MKEEHVLRQAAKELLEAGFRVFVWQDDYYLKSWQKGDYTMVTYAYDKDSRIGRINHDEFRLGLDYSRIYIPSRGCGSSCHMLKGSLVFSIKDAMECIENRIWVNNPKLHKDIDAWHNYDDYNKTLNYEVKTVEEIENESEQ